MSKKEILQKIANAIMNIDHVGVQCDDIHKCEEKHQAILLVDKLDKHEAIRLLFHIIHVQQLQLANATIVLDETNPFKDMINFDAVENYISCNSPNSESLY
jgi:hypothetical protein